MTSNFLNQMGLANLDYGIVLLVMIVLLLAIFIIMIVLLVNVDKYKKKYKKFMQGKDGKSLEKDIMSLYEDNSFMKTNIALNEKHIEDLYYKHEFAYQKIGLVKYDAFKEMGGMLSFSLAILNQNNDGIILNSVHSSEGCYSYTKKIKNGTSEIELSNEEKKAIAKAIENGNHEPVKMDTKDTLKVEDLDMTEE